MLCCFIFVLIKVCFRLPKKKQQNAVRELNGSGNVADKIAVKDQRLDEVALHGPGGRDATGMSV